MISLVFEQRLRLTLALLFLTQAVFSNVFHGANKTEDTSIRTTQPQRNNGAMQTPERNDLEKGDDEEWPEEPPNFDQVALVRTETDLNHRSGEQKQTTTNNHERNLENLDNERGRKPFHNEQQQSNTNSNTFSENRHSNKRPQPETGTSWRTEANGGETSGKLNSVDLVHQSTFETANSSSQESHQNGKGTDERGQMVNIEQRQNLGELFQGRSPSSSLSSSEAEAAEDASSSEEEDSKESFAVRNFPGATINRVAHWIVQESTLQPLPTTKDMDAIEHSMDNEGQLLNPIQTGNHHESKTDQMLVRNRRIESEVAAAVEPAVPLTNNVTNLVKNREKLETQGSPENHENLDMMELPEFPSSMGENRDLVHLPSSKQSSLLMPDTRQNGDVGVVSSSQKKSVPITITEQHQSKDETMHPGSGMTAEENEHGELINRGPYRIGQRHGEQEKSKEKAGGSKEDKGGEKKRGEKEAAKAGSHEKDPKAETEGKEEVGGSNEMKKSAENGGEKAKSEGGKKGVEHEGNKEGEVEGEKNGRSKEASGEKKEIEGKEGKSLHEMVQVTWIGPYAYFYTVQDPAKNAEAVHQVKDPTTYFYYVPYYYTPYYYSTVPFYYYVPSWYGK